MNNIIKYVLLFFFYSAAGWLLESVYCSIGEKKIINRGFLTGPLCPIYGTAAIVMALLIYNPFKDKPLIVFLLGIIFCDIVEYITSYVMEKLFAARWWDYTYELCNINGRICLKHSLYWGVISVIFVKTIHPAVEKLYDKINGDYIYYIFAVVMIIFIIDVTNSVVKALDIRKLQRKLTVMTDTLTAYLSDAKEAVGDKYHVFREGIVKHADKVSDFKLQLEDLYDQFEIRFNKIKKSEGKAEKIKSFSSRIFYNNPLFEKLTKKQLERLKNIVEDIKSNIYDNEG